MSVTSVGYEADEADEADELYESDEADESDEAFEADEADESDEVFEADEADERLADERLADEAEPFAVLQERDRARRAAAARALAADQRAVAARAQATQQNLSRAFSAIRGAGPVRLRATGRLEGSGVVKAELSNGRTAMMRLTPALASVRDVNVLTARISANEKRTAAAETTNSRAINRLAAAQAKAVKDLTAQQVASTTMLTKRIASGDDRLDKRITQELNGRTGTFAKQRRELVRQMRTQRQRTLWNTITIATSLPFFAAYGDTQNPFSRNNLTLTGSLAGWLLLDEIVDQFAGKRARAGWAGTAADTWSYLAPIGNAVTVWYLLKERQHERFIVGITKVTGNQTMDFPLPIKADSRNEFNGANPAVVATLRDTKSTNVTGVVARVEGGTLKLTLTSSPGQPLGTQDSADVAWVVDTHAPDLVG